MVLLRIGVWRLHLIPNGVAYRAWSCSNQLHQRQQHR